VPKPPTKAQVCSAFGRTVRDLRVKTGLSQEKPRMN
jgi:hypothetical protein